MASTEMLYMMLEQADRDRVMAETEVRRTQGEALSAQHQLQRLLDYQYTYRQRWGTLFRKDSSEDMIQTYRGFMSRLQARISSQERMIKERTRIAATAREALRLQEKRIAAMRELLRQELAPDGAPLFPLPDDTIDPTTGLQQFNGFVDTQYGVSQFRATTLVDIDLPIIPTWQPADGSIMEHLTPSIGRQATDAERRCLSAHASPTQAPYRHHTG